MTGYLSDPLVGQILGNYAILSRVGTGGMAVVYKAKHLQFGRIVALKTLRSSDPVVMERFAREIRTLALLKHPNIVEAIDCLQTQSGQTFLVMEYVEGCTLEELLKVEGRIGNEEDFASVMSQVCDALEHAHQQRVIHRDLKPANIVLVEAEGKIAVKVLDFGIAKLQDELQKLTSAGHAMGSPLYMSPEQCSGQELSPASDIYTLAVVAYQMICGRLPYPGPSVVEVMTNHCDPNIMPDHITDLRPEIPGVKQLNQIIFKGLNTDPNKRFQSTGELKKAINMWIQSTRESERSISAPGSDTPPGAGSDISPAPVIPAPFVPAPDDDTLIDTRSKPKPRRKTQEGSDLSKSVHNLTSFKKKETMMKTVKLSNIEVKKATKEASVAAKVNPLRMVAIVVILPTVILALVTLVALNFEQVTTMIDNLFENSQKQVESTPATPQHNDATQQSSSDPTAPQNGSDPASSDPATGEPPAGDENSTNESF